MTLTVVSASPPAEPSRTAVRSKPLRGFSLSPSLAHPSLRSGFHARSVGQGRLVQPVSRRLNRALATLGDGVNER